MISTKIGDVFSETSFYTVKDPAPGKSYVILENDLGIEVTLSEDYVKDLLQSADNHDKIQRMSKTKLAETFLEHSRMACTVNFIPKGDKKTKRDYNAEVTTKLLEIKRLKGALKDEAIKNLALNPILQVIPGTPRTMRGRHYGKLDDLGRVNFVDMDETMDRRKAYDTRLRKVDPRTIQWFIAGGTKYILK
jgi:hypothetical protein